MRKTRKVVTLVGLLQAAAMLTIVFSFLTAIDIALFGIELFSPFRLQYLAVSLLLLSAFAILRNPSYAIALLVTAVFNASLVLPWYLGDGGNATGTELKLLNANVLADNDDYSRLLELIAVEQPDVIFLLEFSPEWETATKPLQVDYPYSYRQPRHDNFGIAMFSRVPLETVTHVDSPPLGYPTIVTAVLLGDRRLTLIGTHPTVPITQSLYDARNAQLQSLEQLVDTAAGPVVLCGDLNASVWDHSYKRLQENTGLRNARRGFGVLPSWPTFMPFAMIPIDHVMVSEQVQVVEARTAGRIGSDHLPLVVTIAL